MMCPITALWEFSTKFHPRFSYNSGYDVASIVMRSLASGSFTSSLTLRLTLNKEASTEMVFDLQFISSAVAFP